MLVCHPVHILDFELEPRPEPELESDPYPTPGLLKILKKYDKRMLTNLRAPFIRTVSVQPFTTTDMLTKLIAQCEKVLEMVLPLPMHAGSEGQASADAAPGEGLGTEVVAGIRSGGDGGAALDGMGGRKRQRVGRYTEVNATPLLSPPRRC